MTVFIYALLDPDTNEVRYIGKTNNLAKRMRGHCGQDLKRASYKSRWIKKLIASGKKPKITVIEECAENNWQVSEKHWIAYYRSIGARLTNQLDGGQGGDTARFRTVETFTSDGEGFIFTARITTVAISLLNRTVKKLGIKQADAIDEAIYALAKAHGLDGHR